MNEIPSERQRVLLVTADGEIGGGSLLVLQLARHLLGEWEVHLATTADTWLADEARRGGITVHTGRFRGARSDLRAFSDLRSIVRSVRPAIVHAHGTRSMLHTLALGVRRRRAGAPVVVHTVHGIHALHHREPMRSAGLVAQRISSMAAACTTFVSTAELDLARRHHLLPAGHDARVILNGTPDVSGPPTTVPRHVVWVGRMVEQKDPVLAARTAVALAASGHTVQLVGDGPLLPTVRSVVDASAHPERIEISGRLDSASTERAMAAADVVLLTSAWEGLPLVALEAMRYGIPVVGADVDGVREVLGARSGATLVTRRDPAALAAAVREITEDRTGRARRAIDARQAWELHHRLEDCLAAYDRLHHELLDGAASTRGRLHEVSAAPSDGIAPDCSVVIVNFNGGEMVCEAARSALSAGEEAAIRVQVLVVDNDSRDGSPEALEQIPGVTVVRSGGNVGFPAACNTGIARSRGEVVLLLNPDALLDAPALRTGLAVLASQHHIGLLGLAQRDRSGTGLPVTYRFPSVAAYLRRQVLGRVDPDAERPATTAVGSVDGRAVERVDGYLSGACLFARRADLLAIDGLDPDLFWAEDADLCRRMRDRGLTVALVPDVSVVHAASTIRNRFLDLALFQQYRGYLRYVQVHDGTLRAAALAAIMAIEITGKWAVSIVRNDEHAVMRRRAYRAVLPALAGWAIGRSEPRRLPRSSGGH